MWDESVDLIIVGSGGGGLVAALAAQDAGMKPLVIEKQKVVGGSTAMSGGVVWMPNNPLMRAQGVHDSDEAGMQYFQSLVGDIGPASSLERRAAFMQNGSAMIRMLQRKGVRLVRCPGFSDYYDTLPGGNAEGRSIESVPWDAHKLGSWHSKLNPGKTRGFDLVFKTNELKHLPVFTRSLTSFGIAMRILARTQWSKLRGKDLVANGMALIGQILKIAVDSGIPIWLDSPAQELITERGRVVGIRVMHHGTSVAVEGRKGVLLAAGGFERNADMRRMYSGDQPNEAQWTIGNLGNTGEVLTSAIEIGARTDLMDEAWWNPATRVELRGTVFNVARKLPGTICVDNAGKRFVNEANSYVEFGKAQYANHAVPCWVIFDDGFRRRYAMRRPRGMGILKALPGRLPKEWVDKGWLRKANTLEELAAKIGVDPKGLMQTVQRFNASAKHGKDPDFGRGTSQYNIYVGDPGHKPNASVGPLETAPYYATEIYPSDVGTCGGLVTDEFARVLNQHDEPIPGLYATGNMTATVMGRTYPGAGASIAGSMAFGYAAARHAAKARSAPASSNGARGHAIPSKAAQAS